MGWGGVGWGEGLKQILNTAHHCGLLRLQMYEQTIIRPQRCYISIVNSSSAPDTAQVRIRIHLFCPTSGNINMLL